MEDEKIIRIGPWYLLMQFLPNGGARFVSERKWFYTDGSLRIEDGDVVAELDRPQPMEEGGDLYWNFEGLPYKNVQDIRDDLTARLNAPDALT